MAEPKITSDVSPFVHAIEQLERNVDDYSAFIKKLKVQLSKAKSGLTRKPDTTKQIGTFLTAIDNFTTIPDAVNLIDFRESVKKQLGLLKDRVKNDFPAALRDAAKAVGYEFSLISDGFEFGPFRLLTVAGKESATLQFAKQDVVVGLPLNASAIAEQAKKVKSAIVDATVDVASFSTELHEAMRVSLARQRKSPKQDLRVELPFVILELSIMRRESKTHGLRDNEFLVCRLIVELKTLIQSAENLRADEQFSLETAVLENSKNPKKSVFIPNDLSRSCGEGTYFQAIIFKTA